MRLISPDAGPGGLRGRYENQRSTGFITEQSKLNRIHILSGNWAEADFVTFARLWAFTRGGVSREKSTDHFCHIDTAIVSNRHWLCRESRGQRKSRANL